MSERTVAAAYARRGSGVDCWYSIGLHIGGDGSIYDVLWNGPADKAGLAPGEKIIAVDGQIYSPDRLREAIRDAKGNTEPIKLIVSGGHLYP